MKAALDAIDATWPSGRPALFAPVLAHLREVGEARSATEIEHHFSANTASRG